MKYQTEHYTDAIWQVMRALYNDISSFRFAFGVLFAGLGIAKMTGFLGLPQIYETVALFPCAVFFLWSFCMSAVSMNIDWSETL